MIKKYIFFAAIAFFFITVFAFAGSSDNVSGWAWSENIGWISFNCTNSGTCATSNYGVTVAPNGDFSGYAWSENIGWISFNSSDTQNCPSVPCKAKLKNDGSMEGWGKALAADNNGWDGWIHLSGTAQDASPYGVFVNGCGYDGYAWGSEVIGWMRFRGTNYGVIGTGNACGIEADITANDSNGPVSVTLGVSATLEWCGSDAHPCKNANSCSVSPGGWNGISGTASTGPLIADQTYTLTCLGQGGKLSDSVAITVFTPPLGATCAVNVTEAQAGDFVSWLATPIGGTGTYSYLWGGGPDPNPLDGKTTNPAVVSYTALGAKEGLVEVTSGGQTMSKECDNKVTIKAGILNLDSNAVENEIDLGLQATFFWQTVGFDFCSIDNGIGPVPLECNPPDCPDSQDTVSPTETTTYTLSCTGVNGSDTKQITIKVLKQPEYEEIKPE